MVSNIIQELFDLTHNVALVTGAAQGIGKAIAILLAQAGAALAVSDKNIEGVRRVAKEIEGFGSKALAIEADVSRRDQIEKMVSITVEELHGIDILINNAGIFPPKSTAFDLEEEDWDTVYALNTKGVFLCTKFVAEHMVKRGQGGRIINIASFEGVKPFASGMAHYEASKASVIMLTRSMALFLAKHRIKVNAVAPGIIDTRGFRAAVDSMGIDPLVTFAPRIPLQRLGTPEDVARGVLFLASNAADYITGVCLFIDGGLVHA
jgi:2-deoxy-D-gluconate 3-dehydrogenase